MRSLSTTRIPSPPHLLRADGSYDGRAVLTLAHAEARANVARAVARGVVRRYAAALKCALSDAWETARAHRFAFRRDAELAAMPAAHAAILVAIDARAAAVGSRL